MAPWVRETLDRQPERSSFDLDGANIELLTWGEIGLPGLLLLHGAGAQADWWDVVAPHLQDSYRIAAISWSGMGRSDWRESYRFEQWAREALAAIEIGELDWAGPPVIAAHSLGGSGLLTIGAHHAERIAGGVLVDSFVPRARHGMKTFKAAPFPLYPSVEQALARYRFVPEQGSDYPEIVDHIARHGLREVDGDGHDQAGWTWRFDPQVMKKLDLASIAPLVGKVEVPIALITGEETGLTHALTIDDFRENLPNVVMTSTIPDAAHHIMVDQPLALAESLRSVLESFALRD